jgi:hypothetical protein
MMLADGKIILQAEAVCSFNENLRSEFSRITGVANQLLRRDVFGWRMSEINLFLSVAIHLEEKEKPILVSS